MTVSDRRRRDRARRRTQILDAAAAVFAHRGVDGASMDAIARRAELGKATLYYYFRTKDELHRAVVAEGTERFFAQLAAEVPRPAEDLTALLEALLHGFARFCDEEPRLVQLLAPLLPHMDWSLSGGAGGDGEPRPPVIGSLDELPAHHEFVGELRRLLAHSPWADRPEELLEFLNDTFVALAHKHVAGRGQTARRQVAFVIGLLRGIQPSRGERRP